MICSLPPSPQRPEPMAANRLAVQLSRMWTDRKVLRVKFMECEPALHEYIAGLVEGPRGWNAVSGLQFRFTNEEDAEVRIRFQRGASWSHVGTDALWVQPHYNTCNLAVRIEDAGAHIDRSILHELGHAMGFIHGQQTPWVGALEEEAVYAWYTSRGYTRSWVESNVITRYSPDDVMVIGGKVPSVMNYEIPAEFWQDRLPMETAAYPTYWDAYAAETFYGPPPKQYTSVILPWIARN